MRDPGIISIMSLKLAKCHHGGTRESIATGALLAATSTVSYLEDLTWCFNATQTKAELPEDFTIGFYYLWWRSMRDIITAHHGSSVSKCDIEVHMYDMHYHPLTCDLIESCKVLWDSFNSLSKLSFVLVLPERQTSVRLSLRKLPAIPVRLLARRLADKRKIYCCLINRPDLRRSATTHDCQEALNILHCFGRKKYTRWSMIYHVSEAQSVFSASLVSDFSRNLLGICTGRDVTLLCCIRTSDTRNADKVSADWRFSSKLSWYNNRVRTMRVTNQSCHDCAKALEFCRVPIRSDFLLNLLSQS